MSRSKIVQAMHRRASHRESIAGRSYDNQGHFSKSPFRHTTVTVTDYRRLPKRGAKVSWLREIDRWFIDEVLPHAPTFRAKAAMLIGREQAEDLVQDAYARVLAAPNFKQIENPRAFTLTVIQNLAIQRMRRANIVHIDHLASIESIDVADTSPDAFTILASKSELQRLMRIIEALPPQCGRVVRMRKIDGLPPGQIAETLGISVSTVEKHLAKGMALMTDAMQEGGVMTEDSSSHLWKVAKNDRN
jgi:RNA polymerase sigma factor (sigma-70 family)